MNTLKRDIENYLSCNEKMGIAKNNIENYFKKLGLPKNCIENAISYLAIIQNKGHDIDKEINAAVECFSNINCSGNNECTCFPHQTICDLLKGV